MNVWYISDTESAWDNLEGFLTHTVKDLQNTAIMIVLDMARPWSVMDQLDKWKVFLQALFTKDHAFSKHYWAQQD